MGVVAGGAESGGCGELPTSAALHFDNIFPFICFMVGVFDFGVVLEDKICAFWVIVHDGLQVVDESLMRLVEIFAPPWDTAPSVGARLFILAGWSEVKIVDFAEQELIENSFFICFLHALA